MSLKAHGNKEDEIGQDTSLLFRLAWALSDAEVESTGSDYWYVTRGGSSNRAEGECSSNRCSRQSCFESVW